VPVTGVQTCALPISALEERMAAHIDEDVEVARRAAIAAGRALARVADLLLAADARRNLDLQRALLLHLLLPVTGAAGRGDDLPFPIAARAGRDVDVLAENGLLHAPDLARAPALRAGLRVGPRLGARAVAVGADFRAHQLDFFLRAEDRFLEVDGQVVAQVGAPPWSATAPPARAVKAAEELLEEVRHRPEAGERIEAGPRAPDAGMAEAVVGRALGLVGEDFVRLADLLELLVGAVFGTDVGVILAGQPAIRFLDLFFCRRAWDAQHVIVVAFICHNSSIVGAGRTGHQASLVSPSTTPSSSGAVSVSVCSSPPLWA